MDKIDAARLKLESEATEQPAEPKLNGIEYQIFRLKAIERGIVVLELPYVRSGEKDTPPAKRFRITVEIR